MPVDGRATRGSVAELIISYELGRKLLPVNQVFGNGMYPIAARAICEQVPFPFVVDKTVWIVKPAFFATVRRLRLDLGVEF